MYIIILPSSAFYSGDLLKLFIFFAEDFKSVNHDFIVFETVQICYVHCGVDSIILLLCTVRYFDSAFVQI